MTTALVERGAHVPEAVDRRGITESQWRALFNLFPGGKPESVLMVWDYCTTRKLDPFKKPCHIVEMDYKDADGQWRKRDVVMPGIYEYRITAHRTGLYLGHTEPEYGPIEEFANVKAPSYCSMTFYRWSEVAKEKIPYPITVYFAEVVATNRDGKANARWTKAPRQMLTKCTEAAGLRETFPEELGGEATAEEMEGQRPPDITATAMTETQGPPQPAVRISQQQQNGGGTPPTPAAVVASAAPASAPSSPPPAAETTQPPAGPRYIGKITSVEEKPRPGKNPFYIIRNEQGYVCTTFSQSLATAASEHQKNETPVELSATAAKNPNYAPRLDEIIPVFVATAIEPEPEPEA